MERVDVATDQIGFPDGDEGGPAAAPSLGTSGCRAPGRDRRSRSSGRALPFLPGPSKIRRCASPARIAASAVGSTPLGCRSSCCPKTERAPRPVPSFRRHKRGDNQIDRTRVLEVRIQSPPAVSQANFRIAAAGSTQIAFSAWRVPPSCRCGVDRAAPRRLRQPGAGARAGSTLCAGCVDAPKRPGLGTEIDR